MDMFDSKKLKAMLIGMMAAFLSTKIGLTEEVTTNLLQALSLIVGSYVLGQGIADHGKEAAKIEWAGEVVSGSAKAALEAAQKAANESEAPKP